MKALFFTLILFFTSVAAFACPVCEKQQPKILQGIAHGAGPQGNLDYVIVWATVISVLFTLYFSVKWIIKPEEQNSSHIKRTVLN